MKLRLAEIEDHEAIVNIHQEAFKGFFLTELGRDFLRTYYKSSLRSEECIAVVLTDQEDKIHGFGIGCILSKGYHKRLLKDNFGSFLIAGIRIALTKPVGIVRLIKNLDKNAQVEDDGLYAELLSIGIGNSSRGTGVGKELIKYFEEETKARGCDKLTLTTDYTDNDNVLTFYRKSGYRTFYEFTAYPNRRMYKLIKEF